MYRRVRKFYPPPERSVLKSRKARDARRLTRAFNFPCPDGRRLRLESPFLSNLYGALRRSHREMEQHG